jgi:addiction module HigA family antidote
MILDEIPSLYGTIIMKGNGINGMTAEIKGITMNIIKMLNDSLEATYYEIFNDILKKYEKKLQCDNIYDYAFPDEIAAPAYLDKLTYENDCYLDDAALYKAVMSNYNASLKELVNNMVKWEAVMENWYNAIAANKEGAKLNKRKSGQTSKTYDIVNSTTTQTKEATMPKSQETPASALQSLMKEYQISIRGIARLLKYSAQSLSNIINGRTSITPSLALRLAKLFNTKPEYWLTLQMQADIAKTAASPALIETLKAITPVEKPTPATKLSSGKPAAAKGGKPGKSPAAKPNPEGKPPKPAAAKKPGKEPAKPEPPAAKTARKSKAKKA